ncbi:MAG: ribosome biogenesis GTPase Der [Acidobacteria bacterium]|nr:MAG: ribosome biogenesis GTPase Der [Acidobacteriota bacterium]
MPKAPLIAIVGRPNVGKSTLFNRLVGSRRAIVGDEPGITRDRLYGDSHWRGHDLRVVDTGGIVPEEKDFIPAEIFRQARVAFEEAAAIVMVVDGRSELAAPDLELARLLQKTGKPLFLAVNKVDSVKQESLANDFHGLGIREIFPISAEHGRGIDDLLDAVVSLLTATNLSTATETDAKDKVRHGQSKRSASRARKSAKSESPPFPKKGKDGAPADLVLSHDERRMMHDGFAADEQRTTDDDPAEVRESVAESDVDSPTRETRVAIIGHPNVGKSTLLNRLTGADRAIVSPVPGTTRDAVDEIVERDGKTFRFIDTAGIRRKGKTHLMAEKLSVVMARKHLEAADIALLVIDATEGVSALDAAIAGYAHESGRSVIILVNKWDLVSGSGAGANGDQKPRTRAARLQDSKKTGDREAYEQRLRYSLKFLNYAPVLFVSAAKGKGTDKIFPVLDQVAAERRKRITTGEMNRFLKHVDFDRASVPLRQRMKILYLTQAAVAPPTFVLFTDRQVKLHFSYQRFLENQIRHAFGFVGTPIWIKVRTRG